MYCSNCGTSVPDGSKFCPSCGKEQKFTPVTQNADLVQSASNDDIDALTRRANAYIDRYEVRPDVEWAGMASNWKDIFDFDPLFLVKSLRTDLVKMLMEVTDYRYDESFFNPVVERSYNARYDSMVDTVKKYFYDLLENFCAKRELIFTFSVFLDNNLHYLFVCSKSLFELCAQTHDNERLLMGIGFAKIAESYYIDASSGTWQLEGVTRSNYVFLTPRYYQDAQYFRQLYQYAETTLQQMNPAGAKAVEQLHANMARDAKEKSKKRTISIVFKIIMTLLTPLMLYLNYRFAPLLGYFDYSDFPVKLIMIVAGVLIVVAVVQSFIIKNEVYSAVFDIVLWVILYPICWIVTAAVQLIAVVIILLILFFVGGSRSTYI